VADQTTVIFSLNGATIARNDEAEHGSCLDVTLNFTAKVIQLPSHCVLFILFFDSLVYE
jgi:hypothetical protein